MTDIIYAIAEHAGQADQKIVDIFDNIRDAVNASHNLYDIDQDWQRLELDIIPITWEDIS